MQRRECRANLLPQQHPEEHNLQQDKGKRPRPTIGGYIPPKYELTIESIGKAFDSLPKRPRILLGDLNVNLNNSRSGRGLQIATLVADLGLKDLIIHFHTRASNVNGVYVPK
jgi:hypothetical protein